MNESKMKRADSTVEYQNFPSKFRQARLREIIISKLESDKVVVSDFGENAC